MASPATYCVATVAAMTGAAAFACATTTSSGLAFGLVVGQAVFQPFAFVGLFLDQFIMFGLDFEYCIKASKFLYPPRRANGPWLRLLDPDGFRANEL